MRPPLTFYLILTCSSIVSSVDLSWWLRRSEAKFFSQNGEDGLLNTLIDFIEASSGITLPPNYIEFGVQDGAERNTRHLQQTKGYTGILLDGSHQDASINLHQRFVTAENINEVLTALGAPLGDGRLGVLCIDIDMNDWHVWRALLEGGAFRAVVVIVEYNSSISPDEALVVPYDPARQWDGSHHYGASLRALVALGRRHGYALAACDSSGTNAFFIDTRWGGWRGGGTGAAGTTFVRAENLAGGGDGGLLGANSFPTGFAGVNEVEAFEAAGAGGAVGTSGASGASGFAGAWRGPALPSLAEAYVRAAYTDAPPSTAAEYDARLAVDVTLPGGRDPGGDQANDQGGDQASDEGGDLGSAGGPPGTWGAEGAHRLHCPVPPRSSLLSSSASPAAVTTLWGSADGPSPTRVSVSPDPAFQISVEAAVEAAVEGAIKGSIEGRYLKDCATAFAETHGLRHGMGCADLECVTRKLVDALQSRRWLRVDDDGQLITFP